MVKNILKYLVTVLLVANVAFAQPSGGAVRVTDGTRFLSITAASAAKVDGSGVTQPMSAASLPLPSGAATSALQGTTNTSLSSIDGKTPALGQALAASSSPVVLTAAQMTTLTPLSTVGVSSVPSDPFGANADAASATGSISAKLRSIAGTGIPITGTVIVGSHAVTNAGTFATQSAAAGDVASGSSDSGNPVKVGLIARSSDPTAVTNAQRVNAFGDLIGRQVVVPYTLPENTWTTCLASDITNTTSTSVKTAGSGSVRHYITSISISNMAASVATRVDILDGSTVVWSCPAAANGGGCTQSFPAPLRGTAATAINAQPATTASQTRACVSGYDAVN